MDDLIDTLRGVLGPMTFGAILGFVVQVAVFRPPSWWVAMERAVVAAALANIFTKFFVDLAVDKLSLERTEELFVTIAAVLALGGVELVRVVRKRILKTAGEGDLNG